MVPRMGTLSDFSVDRRSGRANPVGRVLGLVLGVTLATGALSVPGAVAAGAESGPIGFAMSRHIGWEVDETTHGKICVVASGAQCRSRRVPSAEPGGFQNPSSVATDPRTGNLYVADTVNDRVQELTAAGEFIATFGWEVNETKDRQATATQQERNLCTAASGDFCKAGVPGGAAGQLSYPFSVAVDPRTGDVYVLEISAGDVRVDKFTPGGSFVWMVGKDVNASTKGNLCTASEILRSGVRCQAGAENGVQSVEPGAFKSAQQYGDLLAAGGSGDLLYVGDEHRVQEFDSEGHWKREVLLASISAAQYGSVGALALDPRGDLYLLYKATGSESATSLEAVETVRELNQAGEPVAQFPIEPRLPGAIAHVDGIAIDPAGLMAVIGVELGAAFHMRFGLLYEAATGRLVGRFPPPSDNDGLTFAGDDDLYVAATDDEEVVAYAPVPAADLVTSPVPCEVGAEQNRSSSVFDCDLDTFGRQA
jgi:glucose/arabinose dehydrogenase